MTHSSIFRGGSRRLHSVLRFTASCGRRGWERSRPQRTRDWPDLVLALVLAAACVVIKNPGKVWLLVLIPGILVAWLPRYGLRIAAACFAVAAIGALVLTRIGLTILGYHLQLEFDMPWNGLSEAYFTFANWHLLFYGALAVALLGWRHLLSRGNLVLAVSTCCCSRSASCKVILSNLNT